MAVVISAMAPNCTPSLSLHGSSRLSRASSGASVPPPALAKEDAQDTLFTDEEFQALMSGQCELLSFSETTDLWSPSPLLSLQLQAQQLCRDDEDAGPVQETPPFALDDLEEPISDEDIERLVPLFCDEEIEALCSAPAQQASSMQFSWPRPDDQPQPAGRKRMPSPPWPSCIADDDEEDEEEAGPPPPSPPPPPTKKARTQTKSSISHDEHAADARAARLEHRRRRWRNTMATRILTRQFRAPELSRGRTALRCQCPELVLADGCCCCCALHQDALPEDRAWMFSAQAGHQAPLVGWPGEVLVPAVSAGDSKAMVRLYARWRRSVWIPSRFYVQRAVEKGLAQVLDNDWTMPEC